MMRVYSLTHIGKKIRQQDPLTVILEFGLILITVMTLMIIAFKYLENVTWMESTWQIWQTTTTVGYGNRPAETTAGRLLIMTLSMITISILGVTIGAVFDYRDELKTKRRIGRMDNPYTDGIVLFNFPGTPKFVDMERELRAFDPDMGICVVDEKLEELPLSIASLPKIHFLRGSILEEDTYRRSRISQNRVIVVFPENFSSPQSDASTRVIVDLLRKFTGDKVRIIYILVDQRNAWMFRDVDPKVTPILDSMEILALVQEIHDIYSAPVIQNLLLNSEGANPITVQGTELEGWKWGDFQIACTRTARNLKTRVTALALVKNGLPETCPFYDDIIKKEDSISLVAYNDFQWKPFLLQLLKYNADRDIQAAG